MVGKKFVILLTALLIFLTLSTQLLAPAMASITFEEISVTDLSVPTEYGVLEIKVVKKDIYRGGMHYVKFNATCRVGQYQCVQVETTEYPAIKLDVTKDLISTSAIPSEYKYWWDNILFLRSPGPNDLWIKYDHPDVYESYNIGVNEAKSLKGNQKIHIHIPRYQIENAKSNNDLYALLASVVQFILALLAVPAVGWIAAAIAAVIVAVLFLINRAIYYFLVDVLQDERGGGWMWAWGFGGWWRFRWLYVSFGSWRDWGWYVFFVIFGGGGGGRYCLMM